MRASPDWQRLRQLRAELQADRRWLAAERGMAATVAVTSTIIGRATVTLQQRLQRFPVPVGIFNDVYRGVAPVLLASPFQGALFFPFSALLSLVFSLFSFFSPPQPTPLYLRTIKSTCVFHIIELVPRQTEEQQ